MTTRWLIRGSFKTTSPLHVGSGDITTHEQILDQHQERCDVAAVVTDHRGRPCIPGTAVKGVVRAWAEKFFGDHVHSLNRIFGKREIGDPNAESGWAEFLTATLVTPEDDQRRRFEKYVPYWRPARGTGIVSNVCISRDTGAAQANKLFYQEFVPEGVSFDVTIVATRLTDDEIALLLAILEQGAQHPTHPYQFGANATDGWGRCDWSLTVVKQSPISVDSIPRDAVGFACCTDEWKRAAPTAATPADAPPHLRAELTLDFEGPFLVNDASRAKTKGETERDKDKKDPRTNFTPLRRADGKVWLPSSSFRGALRQRAEFLLRSLDPRATGDPNQPLGAGPIERIFGQTSQCALLTIEEFVQEGTAPTRRQDFVAIDRFTGGAADGAKFDATYANCPTFKTTLTLDLTGLKPEDLALLSLALRDTCDGNVTFGFGAAKGYGHASGSMNVLSFSPDGLPWQLPESPFSLPPDPEWVKWLSDSLRVLAPSAGNVASPQGDCAPSPVVSNGGGGQAGAAAPAEPVLKTAMLKYKTLGSQKRPVLEVAKKDKKTGLE